MIENFLFAVMQGIFHPVSIIGFTFIVIINVVEDHLNTK